ncbi:type II secretion system F family protein [Methanimicrococcus blatticola]|uniref:Flagellar protein FlaJ n=1 Tax=Methanimicrococcus blatticola TaxID=91560 RepID=A0A484F778_9EURY|nr:type II secretion system F family protein [Methanimicrococcus blatticola]MBZ3934906.1 type II secretion system F family protein [Methanimicrococcus blatticola]MCC2508995.1 type II secretion system F family protein [Methanimicrococcus blatticola]TDQ70975.1 flagellar protein FlaJ [Methanimicrococcus blatticola]
MIPDFYSLFDRAAFFSYRLFGKAAEKMNLSFLNQNLKKSRMSFPAVLYLSFILFISFLIASTGFFLEIAVFSLNIANRIDEEQTRVATVLICIFTVFSIILAGLFLILLPFFKAYDRKLKIEQQLPFAVNYMAAMSIAGVSIENIFISMSQKRIRSVYRDLSDEMKTIAVSVNYFGRDYPSALQKLSEETSSPMFSDFILSSKNTMISGGSFQKFIISKKHEYQSLALQRKEKYFQTLDMLSEIYITVFLAMPLFFMILFFTMTPLSGPQTEQMKVLAYQLVPFLGIFFLLILEIINEKEDL